MANAQTKQCEKCGRFNLITARECEKCGRVFTTRIPSLPGVVKPGAVSGFFKFGEERKKNREATAEAEGAFFEKQEREISRAQIPGKIKRGVFSALNPTQAGKDTIKWLGNIAKENVKAKTFETLGLVIVAIILATFGFLWAAIGLIFFVGYIYLPTEAEVMARAREQAGEKAGTEFTSDINSIRSLTEELKSLIEDMGEAENFLKTIGDKDIQAAFAVRKEITEMKRKRDEMKKRRTEISNRILKKAREKGNQKIIEEVQKIMAEV